MHPVTVDVFPLYDQVLLDVHPLRPLLHKRGMSFLCCNSILYVSCVIIRW